jgi:hypothetical protein
MQIKVTPEKLIKLCVWDNYIYYILGSDKEGQKLLENNEEFEISERDALVIGLLKIIETENLIHKFNTHIAEFLANKTKKEEDLLLVNKKSLDTTIDKFLNKFPDYWEPSAMWAVSLKELVDYIDNMKSELEKLDIHKIVDRNITFELYPANSVRKLLKFNY